MTSTTNSIAWMPAKGRHPVNIGSSLGRALKNRKNKGSPAAATKKSNLPERDFYGFKFNFKASSVDTSRPATIEIKKGSENNQVTAEYPSTQPGEVHMFNGSEQPAKDVDCILIFDEETGTFTLEKLDSFVLLKFDRKQAASSRFDSPVPVAASSSSAAKGKEKQEDYDDVSVMDEDAEGEIDDIPEPAAASISYHREEEEEEEEGEDIPLRQALQSKAKAKAPPPAVAPARPVKALPKSRTEAKATPPPQPSKPKVPPVKPPVATPAPVAAPVAKAPAPAPAPAKSKPPPTRTKKTKAPPTSYPSEEFIEFGKPAKRVRASSPHRPPPPPPPPAPLELSLPGGSSSFAPPPVPASYRPPATSSNNGNITQPESVSALPDGDSSEEDEDWEQVPTATPTIPQAANSAFTPMTLEEDDQLADQLQEEMFGAGSGDEDANMDDDDGMEEFESYDLDPEEQEEEGVDFLKAALTQPSDQQQQREPISLNRYVGGGEPAPTYNSDDDFSSSDESEDD